MLLERIEEIILSKMKLALETEYQSKEPKAYVQLSHRREKSEPSGYTYVPFSQQKAN